MGKEIENKESEGIEIMETTMMERINKRSGY